MQGYEDKITYCELLRTFFSKNIELVRKLYENRIAKLESTEIQLVSSLFKLDGTSLDTPHSKQYIFTNNQDFMECNISDHEFRVLEMTSMV
jgi:hypothetical protein